MDTAFDSPRDTFSIRIQVSATTAPPLAPTGLWGVLRPNAAAMHEILHNQQPEQ